MYKIILVLLFLLFLVYVFSFIFKKNENIEYYEFKNEFDIKKYKLFLGWLREKQPLIYKKLQKEKKKCKKEYLEEKKINWIFYGCGVSANRKKVISHYNYWDLQTIDETILIWKKELKKNNKNENWDYFKAPNKIKGY